MQSTEYIGCNDERISAAVPKGLFGQPKSTNIDNVSSIKIL